MPRNYPPFRGPRLSVVAALQAGTGPVAGRLGGSSGSPVLADASGQVTLDDIQGAAPAPGDWVSGRLEPAPRGGYRLTATVVLAPRRRPSPDPELAARLPFLSARADRIAAARAFFRGRGFLEVETPTRVVCPGLEPHLRAFPSGRRWLITSPELHLKRLLAAGAERIVEFSRAFRDEECGPWHHSEFLLVEWYRAFEDLPALESDCEELVAACLGVAGAETLPHLEGCDLQAPFDRTTVRDALFERTGLDLHQLSERAALDQLLRSRGHNTDPADTWDELFFRIWIAEVEPDLGRTRPVFVHEYPAGQAALARVRSRPDGSQYAERFELYVRGVEVANAFYELNDPDEQRARHLADQQARRVVGAPDYALDSDFLAALESGMPPASGIALGLDRLIALLLGESSLERIRAF